MPAEDPTEAERAALCEGYKQIFRLRNVGGEQAVTDLIELFDSTTSVLLRHEIPYALGQMQHASALPFLFGLLRDEAENAIVRHEAAEALGAIGADDCLEALRDYADDDAIEVSETCQLALARIEYGIVKGTCACERRPMALARAEAGEPDAEEAPLFSEDGYLSVDPAPAADAAPTPELRATLLDRELPLFERYRAMFALRNAATRGDEAALTALCDGLDDVGPSKDSALFRHEIAFVLGQVRMRIRIRTSDLASRSEPPAPRRVPGRSNAWARCPRSAPRSAGRTSTRWCATKLRRPSAPSAPRTRSRSSANSREMPRKSSEIRASSRCTCSTARPSPPPACACERRGCRRAHEERPPAYTC